MIKILHYIPGFAYGGIESLFIDWYRSIERDKFEIELLIRTQDDTVELLREFNKMGGKYYRLAPLSIKRIDLFRSCVKEFFMHHNDYDILHAHGTDPFVFFYARYYGIKHIILHSHSTKLDGTRNAWMNHQYERIVKYFYVNEGFACSMSAAQWKFHSDKFKRQPIFILHNAIDVSRFMFDSCKRNQVRIKMGWNGKSIVGHVGRLTYPKNQFFLLEIIAEALKTRPKIQLVVVGDGPDRGRLVSYAKALGIDKNVEFLGKREDVCDLLQGMDCFLLPSRYEGLPVTLVEAQASGLHCVVSDVITNEAILLSTVQTKGLHEAADSWSKAVIDSLVYAPNERMTAEAVREQGFDMATSIKKLQCEYIRIADKK